MNPIWTSKKLAVFFSYVSTGLNALATVVLTRLYIEKLGDDAYGLYQMIYAVAQIVLILDLGISLTMNRYVTEFAERKDQVRQENFAAHMLAFLAIISTIILIVGAIVFVYLPSIYDKLTVEEIALARHMFAVMIVQIVIVISQHFVSGISLGHDQYALINFLGTLGIVVNFAAAVALLYCGYGFLEIVYAKTIAPLASFLIVAYVVFFKLHFKIRFHYWDWPMMVPAAMLMLAVLLQSIVGHVNSTVDKAILGNMMTKQDVAVYSVAAVFVTMFNTLPAAISNVFQSQATRLVVRGATPDEMTDFVSRPGRYQFILAGGFCAGFILLGQDFLLCWIHDPEKKNAWLYALVIMIPSLIPLIQNVCVPLLNALNKRLFRSLILVLITVVNISLTIFLIRRIGAIGAPLATGISFIIGHVVLINIYYQKRIGLNVFKIFHDVVSKIWVAILGTLLINLPLVMWNANGRWWVFIVKAIAFCVVYAAILWFYGFNTSEKTAVAKIAAKVGVRLPQAS